MVEVAVARHSLTWSGPGGVWDVSSMDTKERRNGPEIIPSFEHFPCSFPFLLSLLSRGKAWGTGFRV